MLVVRRPAVRPGSAALAAVLVSLAAAPGAAQQVRGTVRASAPDPSPVPGATVYLVDSTGAARAATLTDDAGRYALRAPAPGRYTLRARRVGYAPADGRPESLAAGEVVTRALTLVARAGVLPAVRAQTLAECRGRGERAADAARYWTATRDVLEGAAAAEATGMLDVEAALWQRDVDVAGVTLRRRDDRRTGRVARPFTAVDPARLAASGYAEWGADSTAFHAPDATVLVSDAFAAGHCVRVVTAAGADTAHAGAVGLAFEPARARNVLEVRGTLWVDSATAAPREFAFTYVWPRGMVPAEVASRYGGELAFATLPSGVVVVRRWALRVPLPVADRPSAARTWGTRTEGAALQRVRGDGGALLAAWDGDVPRPLDVPAALVGIVYDSLRGGAVAGARVLVTPRDGNAADGTLRIATTDSGGAWRVDSLSAGRWAVAVDAPALDSMGVQLPEAQVTLAAGETARVELHVPGAAAALAALCPTTVLDVDEGMVIGTVRRFSASGARAAPSAMAVELTWGGTRGLRGLVRATVDREGTYRACGVPRLIPVRVRLLAGADGSGRELGATTLRAPRALLAARELTVRGTTVVEAEDPAGAMRLAAVSVTARAAPSTRQRSGGGGRALVFDRATIADRSPSRLTDLLRTNSQLLVMTDGTVRVAAGDRVPARAMPAQAKVRGTGQPAAMPTGGVADPGGVPPSQPPRSATEAPTACTLGLYIDGQRVEGTLDEVSPAMVERLEVYLSAAGIPAQYADSRAGCGVIVVSTTGAGRRP